MAIFRLLLILGASVAGPLQATASALWQDPLSARPVAGTIAIAADCQARWEGTPVTQEQILERTVAIVEAAIDRVGGVQNVTEENLPHLRVEAAPELPWQCVGPTLLAIQRSGIVEVALRDQRAYFTMALHGPGEPAAVQVDIAAGGELSWNGERLPVGALAGRVQTLGDAAWGPDSLFVNIDGRATFGDVYRLLQVVNEAGREATLASCEGPYGPMRPDEPACGGPAD